jgi:methyl-accepting chemotaxis protein
LRKILKFQDDEPLMRISIHGIKKMTHGKNLSINTRLTLLGVAVFMLILALAFNSWRSTSQMGAAEQEASNAVRATRYLADAQNVMWQLRFGISQYLAVPKPEERKKIIDGSPKQFDALDEAIRAYGQLPLTPEQQAARDEFNVIYKQYKDARPHWFELMEAGSIEEAADWRSKTILKSGAGSVKALSNLIALQEKRSNTIDEAGSALVSFSLKANVIVFLVTISALFGLLWLTTRAITKPIFAMIELVHHAVDKNDFTRAISTSTITEIAQISRAFNSLMEKLKSIIEGVRSPIADIHGISKNLDQASAQVTVANHRQSEAAASVAAAVEELSVAIGETASNAQESERVVAHSLEESQRAMTVTLAVMDDVGRIAETVKSSTENVLQLSESSGQISGIVKVIKEIADQTNLLALNAAIEAARAGEQGRGFAVVADEVRKLAERTANSTQEIGKLVETIQNQIAHTVDSMQSMDQQAAQSVQVAAGATSALEKISSGSSEVAQRVEDIGQAIREQNTAVLDISRNVETIAQMTEENTAVASQNGSTASDLARHADHVRSILDQYRI